MRSPTERLKDAIEFISTNAVEGVMAGRAADAPNTVRDVDEYLLRVWEDPEPGLDWEFELRGAICFANNVLTGSVDGIRRMLARAVYRELRRQGLLRRQQKAA